MATRKTTSSKGTGKPARASETSARAQKGAVRTTPNLTEEIERMSQAPEAVAVAEPPVAQSVQPQEPRATRNPRKGKSNEPTLGAAVLAGQPLTIGASATPTTVEQLDDRIVIRFAPVAPHPYPPKPALLQELAAAEAAQTAAEAVTATTRFAAQSVAPPGAPPRLPPRGPDRPLTARVTEPKAPGSPAPLRERPRTDDGFRLPFPEPMLERDSVRDGQRAAEGARDGEREGDSRAAGEPLADQEPRGRRRRRRGRGRGGRADAPFDGGPGGGPGAELRPPAGRDSFAKDAGARPAGAPEPADAFEQAHTDDRAWRPGEDELTGEDGPELVDDSDENGFVSVDDDVAASDGPPLRGLDRADVEPAADDPRGQRRGRRGRGRGRDRDRGMREIEVGGPGAEIVPEADAEEMLSERGADEEGGVEIGDAPRPRPEDEDYRFRRGRRPRIREPREMIDVETADVGTEPPAEKKMVINVVPHEECRIGLLKDGVLEEIYIERASSENHVGNIYKGIITNVEPSIQAAFVDFGIGKNGFLHISDLHPEYFGGGGNDDRTESIGRKTPRRHRPPIQSCLRRGQEVIVQITKEGIGTKGPTLTTYVAIPGRFLVLSSGMQGLGVSRKIEDEEKRRTIRAMLNDLEPIPGMGVIARTATFGRTRQELQNDLNYLHRLWRAVLKRQKQDRAPCELYRESDLVIRTIRDVFTSDVKQIIIDDADVAQRARDFLSIFSPDSAQIVTLYEGDEPIFHKFGIENELERLHARHVPLRSGGSLVIDQTEALVAIDVNSGKFREQADSEDTAFRINMEAADEIPRQLRLRDLGGVVICDFIDLRDPGHRREIEHRLVRNLKAHKERAKILRMSSFGIIEMTRQRQRASLQRSVYKECTHCRGMGLVKTAESVALDVMRLVQLAGTKEHVSRIEIMTSLEVANMLQNRKRSQLHELETTQRRTVIIHPDPTFGLDHIEMRCTDNRGRVVPHG